MSETPTAVPSPSNPAPEPTAALQSTAPAASSAATTMPSEMTSTAPASPAVEEEVVLSSWIVI